MVLLTLDRLGCFSDGCFSDDCFLDDCFLDDCFLDDCFLDGCFLNDSILLWTSQNLNSYFADFEQIKKKYLSLICTHCSWQRFFYIIICQNPFLPVRTRVSDLYAFVWMLKHQKYWYFFSLTRSLPKSFQKQALLCI